MILGILGLQAGYTNIHVFYICGTGELTYLHYTLISCLPGTSFTSVFENVKSDPQNILLSSLHIKLGFMKNYVKALNKDAPMFRFLQRKFSRIYEAKVQAGAFDWPQIGEKTKDKGFTG